MPKAKVELQLSLMHDLLKRDRREEALVGLLIPNMQNLDWLHYCILFSSDLDPKDKETCAAALKRAVLWQVDLIHRLSTYTDKYKGFNIDKIKQYLTPEDKLLSRTEPINGETLYVYHLNHERRLNGLFLGFKDVIKPYHKQTINLIESLRASTLILKKYENPLLEHVI